MGLLVVFENNRMTAKYINIFVGAYRPVRGFLSYTYLVILLYVFFWGYNFNIVFGYQFEGFVIIVVIIVIVYFSIPGIYFRL